jgi:hypothetical protein
MVQLTVSIDADHTLHVFCEADQVDAAIAALRDRLTGKPEATHANDARSVLATNPNGVVGICPGAIAQAVQPEPETTDNPPLWTEGMRP